MTASRHQKRYEDPEYRAKRQAHEAKRRQNPEYLAYKRAQTRKKRTGVSPEQFEETLASQQGLCAICSSELRPGVGGQAADHCHETGHFRGILCNKCNRGLGLFKDSSELLRKAADYLDKPRQPGKVEVSQSSNGKTSASKTEN